MADAYDHFKRSGIVSLDGFASPAYGPLFDELAASQHRFLAREAEFRSSEYPWPSDALRQWSRCWEYPYALAHLRRARATQPAGASVVDLGSGVTFFPFVLAAEGWEVIAVDNDPLVIDDLERAIRTFGEEKRIAALRAEGARLAMPDASVDALYSISVLEHIPDPMPVIAEAARVLRPGGMFVLTMDVDLTGNDAIGPELFDAVMRACRSAFALDAPETTIHPLRMLDTFSGPFPRSRQRQVPGLMWRTAGGNLRPLVGGPIAPDPVHLACYAGVYRRNGG